jgi:aspartyl-tRNA(Asn)/glutamyl-tRNA(Gln) amidotransferase subunit A
MAVSKTAFQRLAAASSTCLEPAAALGAIVHAPPTLPAATAPPSVPITVKANICIKGYPASASSRALDGYFPPHTATVVARLVAAGARVVGVSNMDEFGMGSSTQASVHGACVNPWSPAYAADATARALAGGKLPAGARSDARRRRGWLVPGGSSGGAAVSVATGAARVAVGSDTGGSVRQPAALCGVVGLKPTYGRLSRHGLVPYASSLDTVGLLGRAVWDVAAAYSAAAGADARDETSIHDLTHAPQSPEELARALGLTRQVEGGGECKELRDGLPLLGLRVGVPAEYAPPEGGNSKAAGQRAVAAAWARAGELLTGAGATLVPVSLPTTELATRAYYVIAPAEAASNLARYDGVRYGYRAAQEAEGEAYGFTESAPSAAVALHALYTRTRSESFGREVQKRIMLGNFVLTAGARGDFYEAAVAVREAVRADFGGVFRPAEGEGLSLSLLAASNAAAHPSASAAAGVDILLTPVAPGPAWSADTDGARADPLREYLQDVMTIPASLAHLPALALPVGTAPMDAALLRAAEEDAAAAYGLDASALAAALAERSGKGGLGDCLPVGVQLIGRYGDEETVLRVGAVLEARAAFVGWLERAAHMGHA